MVCVGRNYNGANDLIYNKIEVEGNDAEACAYYGGVDVTNNLQAFHPFFIVEAYGVQCAPEAVGQVEPQGGKPYQIYNYNIEFAELIYHKVVGIGRFHA